MPGEDVTITLSGIPIQNELTVGKYVNYDTSTLSDISISSSLTGASTYTVSPASYTGSWIVVSNNGTTVKIIAATNVASGVTVRGTTGYYNIGTICSNINNAYLNSSYASAVTNPTSSYSSIISDLQSYNGAAFTGATSSGTNSDGSSYYCVGTTYGNFVVYDGEDSSSSSVSQPFRPIITLNTDLYIGGGSGTQADPYTLSIN